MPLEDKSETAEWEAKKRVTRARPPMTANEGLREELAEALGGRPDTRAIVTVVLPVVERYAVEALRAAADALAELPAAPTNNRGWWAAKYLHARADTLDPRPMTDLTAAQGDRLGGIDGAPDAPESLRNRIRGAAINAAFDLDGICPKRHGVARGACPGCIAEACVDVALRVITEAAR